MSGRIVLFGATGYTGELTARALVDRGAQPVLAGRSRERLDTLAGALGGGLETRVADVSAPETLRALVGRGDVLVSTVGPFVRFGEPVVAAAVAAGAHYLDSTGEGAFIRSVFERHGPTAQVAGCGLLTAFGYDYVPGNLAGALALRDAGEAATRVEVGYFARGSARAGDASGGTRASMVEIAPSGFAWRRGRLATEPAARHVRAFDLGTRRGEALSVPGTEHYALPRVRPGLRDVGVYVGWAGPVSRAVQALSVGASLVTRVPGARDAFRALLRPLAPGSTGGPDAQARARVGSLVVAEALDAAGARLAAVRVEGVNPYEFTARVLAWGAVAAAAGRLQGAGALGPVDGFGLDALEAGCAEAGMARVS